MAGRRANQRLVELPNSLNRTINKTISRARLSTIVLDAAASRAFIARAISRDPPEIGSIDLLNGWYLSIRMDVQLTPRSVTTDLMSISYRRSPQIRSRDWIFRYEYERQQTGSPDYPYPVAHLHVNPTPEHYVGKKPFPNLHLPTRRLSLEEIIRHLIVEHGLPTLCPQNEALVFLDEQQAEFDANRTDTRD